MSEDLVRAHYALYAELLDIGYQAAMSLPTVEDRRRALDRLGRGWAVENRERDAMWARMARTLARSGR